MTVGVGRSLVLASMIFLLIAFAAVLPAGCGGSGGDLPSAGGSGGDGAVVDLSGAGATFPEPLYVEWMGEFMQIEPGVEINYQGIGSGGGIQQFTLGTVDFGATDAPMTDEEIQVAEEESGARVLHIPTVLGAVVVSYNLEGVEELRLDGETLSGIFLGEITAWQDPRIVALNEGVDLPDRDIQVVHRSDSSGTTNIFTGYLSAVSEAWAAEVGTGKDVQWPVGLGGQGNDGSAAVVQQQAGSIGYVELSYATETGLSQASLKNAAGEFVAPGLESTAAAGEGVEVPEDLRFSLVDSQAPGAYPIVGATWILAHDRMADQRKAEALKDFLRWAIEEGDARAEELQYAPIAGSLEEKALAKIDAIGY